jgi:hypothetical protein
MVDLCSPEKILRNHYKKKLTAKTPSFRFLENRLLGVLGALAVQNHIHSI